MIDVFLRSGLLMCKCISVHWQTVGTSLVWGQIAHMSAFQGCEELGSYSWHVCGFFVCFLAYRQTNRSMVISCFVLLCQEGSIENPENIHSNLETKLGNSNLPILEEKYWKTILEASVPIFGTAQYSFFPQSVQEANLKSPASEGLGVV